MSVVVAPQQPLPAHPTQPAAPFVVVAGHATSEPAAASSTDSLRLLTEKLSSLALEGSGHVGGGSYDELLRSLADKSRENVTLSVALRKQQTDVARLTQLNAALTQDLARASTDARDMHASLSSKVASLSEANTILVADKSELQQSVAQLERQCAERDADLHKHRQALSQMQHKIFELEQARVDHHRTQAEFETSKRHIEQLQRQIQQLTQSRQGLTDERDELATRLQRHLDSQASNRVSTTDVRHFIDCDG